MAKGLFRLLLQQRVERPERSNRDVSRSGRRAEVRAPTDSIADGFGQWSRVVVAICDMPHFLVTFGDPRRPPVGAVIIETPSMFQARVTAVVRRLAKEMDKPAQRPVRMTTAHGLTVCSVTHELRKLKRHRPLRIGITAGCHATASIRQLPATDIGTLRCAGFMRPFSVFGVHKSVLPHSLGFRNLVPSAYGEGGVLPIGFPPSILRTLCARKWMKHNVLSDMYHLITCQVFLPNGLFAKRLRRDVD
jgi:hypothetical protein